MPNLGPAEGFAAPLIYFELSSKLQGPIIIEYPYYASLMENKREIIVLKSYKDSKWEDHMNDTAIESLMENVRNDFGSK